MKKGCISIVALAMFLGLAGCSSSTDTDVATAGKSTDRKVVNGASVPAGDSNSVTSIPGQTVEAVPGESTAAAPEGNVPDAGNSNTAFVPGSLADIKNKKARRLGLQSAPASSIPVNIQPQPAPEDSEFIAELKEAAIETRTFRSHPQLWKVEKRTDGKGSTATIYLRDQRVVNVAGDKIPKLATAASADILRLAGVAPAPNPGTVESKPRKQSGN